jgi:hypothetical protein
LNIVGEVLSNPITDKGVDYITLVKGDISDAGSGIGRERLPCVYLRGGCDLAVLGHYVGMAAEKIVGEYNIIQNGLPIRLDHSMIARYVIEGIPKGAEPAVEAVGYASDNFRSELLTERSNDGICILSFFADAWVPLFRHKDTRAMVPFLFTKTSGKNPILLSEEELKYLRGDSRVFRAVEALRNEFEFVGLTPEEDFHYNITLVFRTIQENTIVFVLYNSLGFMGKMARYDEILKEVARNYKNVRLLNVVDFYRSRDDVAYEGYHLLPSVYSRIFEKIKKESLPQSCD